MYRNSEGYADPTAGAALSNLGREKVQQRRNWARKKALVLGRPKVYVISAFAGDTAENIKKARRYCRYVASQQKIPFASHLLYPQFLDDGDLKERELGLIFGMSFMKGCQEVWCFGTRLSKGMKLELEEAERRNKPIRYFTEDMEEIE